MYDIHKQGIAMCPTDLSDKQQALDKSSTRLFSALKLLFVEATHAALKFTLFHILAKHKEMWTMFFSIFCSVWSGFY